MLEKLGLTKYNFFEIIEKYVKFKGESIDKKFKYFTLYFLLMLLITIRSEPLHDNIKVSKSAHNV